MFASTSTFGKPSPSFGFGSSNSSANAGNSMFNATSSSVSNATQSSSGVSGFGVFSKPFGSFASTFRENSTLGGFGSMASQANSSNGGFGAFCTSSSASNTPSFNSASTYSNTQSSSAPSFTSSAFGTSNNALVNASCGMASVGGSLNVFGAFTKPIGEKPVFGGFGSMAPQTSSSTPSFNFGSTSSNSQPFSFGTNNTVEQSGFQFKPKKGSRVTGYRRTDAFEDDIKSGLKNYISISAMPDYSNKSHEELRWEDCELQGKAPPVVESNPFGLFPRTSSINSPSSTIPLNPSISQKWPVNSDPTSKTSPFSPISTTTAPVTISTTMPSFPPLFVSPDSSASTTSTPSPFSPSIKTNSIFTTPSKPLESTWFKSPPSPFPSPFVSSGSSSFTTVSTPSPFSPSMKTNRFFTTPSKPSEPSVIPSVFCPPNSTPWAPCSTTVPSLTTISTTPNSVPSLSLPLSNSLPSISPTVNQPAQDPPKPEASSPKTIQNPFGTVSNAHSVSSAPVQYGISSIPVADKPTPVRVTSLLTTRHLSQRRIKLPARKLHPRVPFYCDDEESLRTKMADTVFFPRENPRELLISPNGKSQSKASMVKESPSSGTQDHGDKDDGLTEKVSEQSVQGDQSFEADIEAKMPKLKHNDYYTEPPVQELAAKERAEPGFCKHVKDFVVGRHGFGSVLFIGETDVRKLDLESLIQFNAREITVYMDASKKPPVGEGLNKPAVVTLHNIKCFDWKTGQQVTKGEKVEKYKDLLLKKAREQDAEFVSYDPLVGEWKFRVDHF